MQFTISLGMRKVLPNDFGNIVANRCFDIWESIESWKNSGDNMRSKEECRFYSDHKCIAADLEHCDFEGENHEKCLCYRIYYLKPQTMQLR